MKKYQNKILLSSKSFSLTDDMMILETTSVNTIVSRSSPLNSYKDYRSESTKKLSFIRSVSPKKSINTVKKNKNSLFEFSEFFKASEIHAENIQSARCSNLLKSINQNRGKSVRSDFSKREGSQKKCISFRDSELKEYNFDSENESLDLSVNPQSVKECKTSIKGDFLEDILKTEKQKGSNTKISSYNNKNCLSSHFISGINGIFDIKPQNKKLNQILKKKRDRDVKLKKSRCSKIKKSKKCISNVSSKKVPIKKTDIKNSGDILNSYTNYKINFDFKNNFKNYIDIICKNKFNYFEAF